MSRKEFEKFCNAVAQSYAHQASVLTEKARRLPGDEYVRKVQLERDAEHLANEMEVWAGAHNWYL